MGYLYLLLSNLAGAGKGYCGKKLSGHIKGTKDAVLSNTLRMLLCIVIGYALILFTGATAEMKLDRGTLLITVLAGVSISFTVIFWLLAVKKSAYIILDVFAVLSALVPTISSAIMYGERIRLNQIVGFLILLAATIILCSYNNSIKTKLSISTFLTLLGFGVANGLSDFSQKMFNYTSVSKNGYVYNFYTYLFSTLTLLILYVILSFTVKDDKDGSTKKALGKISLYVSVMSVCLFLNSFFKVMAAKTVDAAILYPCVQGIALLFSIGMSAVFFKEKLTLKCAIGTAMIFAGLLIINCL